MTLAPIQSVRKRDGSLAPFDAARIRAAVAAAQTAVGERDEGFPLEVAELVEFALRRRQGLSDPRVDDGGVPEVEDIQDLVELALIELGRAAVAKAYILYRDRRGRVRESQAARAPAESDAQAALPLHLRVREAERSSPWSKGRIIAALVDEAGVSRGLAEEVARRVEQRVLQSGLRRISTSLVRELVDNELVGMGLSEALARHEPVAVARHDLRQLLESGPRAPEAGVGRPPRVVPGERLGEDSVEGAIAGALLRRVALEDLFGDRTTELHTTGELHVEDVRRPHLHLVQSLPLELCLRGKPSAQAAFELLDELARLTASVSRGIVLEQPAQALAALARSGRPESAGGLAAWLAAVRALARASGRRIDLSRPGTRSSTFLSRLVTELAVLDEVAEPGPIPRLFLEREELAALLETRDEAGRQELERLIAAGICVPVWGRPDERFSAPGCRRRGREPGAVACGGAVALNLARLARRAGPWREDLLLEELARLVESAVEALAELSRFQRAARAARAGEARGRIGYVITPVGLREALRVLGDGELRPAQGARLLGLVSEAARRFAQKRGLSVGLSPFFGRRAAARFAELDSERPQARQGVLFEELARAGAEPDSDYSQGFDAGPIDERDSPARRGALAAELLATVPTGAWVQPTSWNRARDSARERSALGRSALELWQAFDQARIERLAADPGRAPATAPVRDPALAASGELFVGETD